MTLVGSPAFCLSPSGALRSVVWLDGIERLVSGGLLTSLGILLLRVLGRQVICIGDVLMSLFENFA